LNQFLVTPDSSTAVFTNNVAPPPSNPPGSSVAVVTLSSPQTATVIPLANNAYLCCVTPPNGTTPLPFTGDIPAGSFEFVVGGNDDNLHFISFSAAADTVIGVSGLGLLQADGATEALPNLVAIRNQ
jgi:hypothetical protein